MDKYAKRLLISALILSLGVLVLFIGIFNFNLVLFLLGFFVACVGGVVLKLPLKDDNKPSSDTDNNDNSDIDNNNTDTPPQKTDYKIVYQHVDSPDSKSRFLRLGRDTAEKGVKFTRTFKIAGVTFEDRQDNIEYLSGCDLDDAEVELDIDTFADKPAVVVSVDDMEIGYIRANNLGFLLENFDRICGYQDICIDSFVNDDDEQIYCVKLYLLFKNKTK